MMAIAMGSDEAGFDLKEKLKEYLKGRKFEVSDYGVLGEEPVFYSNIAVKVAQAIVEGKHQRGILICGTGIGMAISANKISGIKAMVCHDLNSVERGLKNDRFQIMVLGARIIGEEPAKGLIDAWLKLSDTVVTDKMNGLSNCREMLFQVQSHPGVSISP